MAKNEASLDLVFDAYRRLSHDQLVLFLRVRSLPTTGSDEDLIHRLAHFDIHTFNFPNIQNGWSPSPAPLINGDGGGGAGGGVNGVRPRARPTNRVAELPVEIISEVLDHLGDWELSKAVGVPTSLSRPQEWNRASPCDDALLTGYLPVVRAANPATNPPTRIGATLVIRFAYTHVLDLLYTAYRPAFLQAFADDILPIKASRYNRVGILHWWKHALDTPGSGIPAPAPASIAKAMDEASRGGSVAALDWWLHASGLPLDFTTAALEHASARNHLPVLAWWQASGLPLKISTRVMDLASTAGNLRVLEWWARSGLELKYDKHALHHASAHGRVEVLDWWLASGLQMKYDMAEVLTVASRHNRPEVLEWWDRSALPLQYRMCDIEEALEDAIGGGEAAREWWKRKGVDFYANDKEWMALQTLN